jgi:hypothetical protein
MKRVLLVVCFLLMSLMVSFHIGGSKCFAIPLTVDLDPVKIFLVDGTEDGNATVDIVFSQYDFIGSGTILYSLDNTSWSKLSDAPALDGGKWVYLGVDTTNDLANPEPEITRATDVSFSNPVGSDFAENPSGFKAEYYRTMEIPWLDFPPNFPPKTAKLNILGTTEVHDGLSNVPIPGSGLVLLSLLGGFFFLGKRKKRDRV